MPHSLLLIGGGHAHLFVLEALRQQRARWQKNCQVTLLTRDLQTPYSGMLPGLIAGHYSAQQAHIDLQPLAAAAGVQLIQAQVDRLDLANFQVMAGPRNWQFDTLSIDIGSTPSMTEVAGAAAYAIGIKPIDEFLKYWQQLRADLFSSRQPMTVAVVGGGAGGVELILALKHRFDNDAAQTPSQSLSAPAPVDWLLVTRGELLAGFPTRAVQRMQRVLQRAGVQMRSGLTVTAVHERQLQFDDGQCQRFDALIWATGAAPQRWLAESGVACVDGGFIEIDAQLQSVSHRYLFAAGDIATDPHQLRPKAGVYAVRQGPILAENLLRHLTQQRLLQYRAQAGYLSLLSTGAQHAIGSWRGLVLEGDWLWRCKDAIDQRFMLRFQLPK